MKTCSAVLFRLLLIGPLVVALVQTPTAHADTVAYLVNVTVRPGYHFANADTAVDYGRGVCDRVTRGDTYAVLIADLTTDFGTTDDYQAAYLISQAVNELCPEQIWQLRNSATHYRGDR